MTPFSKTVVRYGLLIVTAAILQRGVFSQLRVDGAVPDALLVLAVAAGIVGGTDRGATVGFFSGLALDLMVTTPFGTLLGRSDLIDGQLVPVAAVVAVSTAILALPAVRACRWADQDLDNLRSVLR
jgi:hypothetical protein